VDFLLILEAGNRKNPFKKEGRKEYRKKEGYILSGAVAIPHANCKVVEGRKKKHGGKK